MRDQDADCVAKPRRTSRCCNSMGSRAFCDTRTGEGGCSLGMHGSPPKRREKKARRSAAGRPSRRFGPPRRSWRTHSLCQEPSETGALSPSTLVRNAPLSVQNRTNLPDTLAAQRATRHRETLLEGRALVAVLLCLILRRCTDLHCAPVHRTAADTSLSSQPQGRLRRPRYPSPA